MRGDYSHLTCKRIYRRHFVDYKIAMKRISCLFTERKWVNVAVAFILWTASAFVSHQSGRLFLLFTGSGLIGAVLLSVNQITYCFLMFDIKRKEAVEENVSTVSCYRTVVALSHVITVFCTNYSMSYIYSSFPIATRMLEPAATVLVQWILFSVPTSVLTLFILPLIISGTIIFTQYSFKDVVEPSSVLWAILAILATATRNITLKTMYGSNFQIGLRSRDHICVLLTITCLGLILWSNVTVFSHVFAFLVALLSSVFHALSVVISLRVIQAYVSVVSLAVISILKRVVVVLVLIAVGSRTITLHSILGLTLLTIGIVIYSLLTRYEQKFVTVMKPLSGRRWIIFAAGGVFLIAAALVLGSVEVTARDELVSPLQTGFDNMSVKLSEKSHKGFHRLKSNHQTAENPFWTSFTNKANRVHETLLGESLLGVKYAFLFDLDVDSPATAVGELQFLKRLEIRLLYYCLRTFCTDNNIARARNLARKYPQNKIVILLHGGSDFFMHEKSHLSGRKILSKFSNYKILIFPLSLPIRSSPKKLMRHLRVYNNCHDLTILIHDYQSFLRATQLLPKTKLIVVPDMAFETERTKRIMDPSCQVVWLKRRTRKSKVLTLPANITYQVADLSLAQRVKGTSSIEDLFRSLNDQMLLLQRGQVVITELLQGHFLSVLLGIPHVLLDDKDHTLSGYFESWGEENGFIIFAQNSSEAVQLAQELLHKYRHYLPTLIQNQISHNNVF